MSRNEILKLVRQYADEKYGEKKEFKPGIDRVPVSGAVIYPEDIEAVVDAVLDGWFTEWKVASKFSRELSKWLGVKHAVLTNSGSSATLLALSALKEYYEIPDGMKVITSPLEFPTTISAIIKVGLVPLFVDVVPSTLSINMDYAMEILDNVDVCGIALSHVLGFPHDSIEVFRQLPLSKFYLEDICDAIGAERLDRKVGTFGDISTLSLFPAHHFTSGEGGVCFTNSEALKTLLDSYRSWGRDCYCLPGQQNTCGIRFEHEWEDLPEGWDHKYTFTRLGYNLKMTELQAALGLSQLSHLDEFIKARKQNYWYLGHSLFPKLNGYIGSIFIPAISSPSHFGYPIVADDAKELMAFLNERKIDTRTIFAGNITKHPMMKNVKYDVYLDLHGADYVMNNAFWVGCHPGLTKAHLDYIAESIFEFYKGK